MNSNQNISDVSRITGIPKDLLRMWERRYGHPKPARDSSGDRICSTEELDKLITIRQLVEQGERPGKLMTLDLPQLRALLQSPKVELDTDHLVDMLAADDMVALHGWFKKKLSAFGLQAFVLRVMAPATAAIGEAWASGRLEIYQEHLYTEMMKSLVRQALAEHFRDCGVPEIGSSLEVNGAEILAGAHRVIHIVGGIDALQCDGKGFWDKRIGGDAVHLGKHQSGILIHAAIINFSSIGSNCPR